MGTVGIDGFYGEVPGPASVVRPPEDEDVPEYVLTIGIDAFCVVVDVCSVDTQNNPDHKPVARLRFSREVWDSLFSVQQKEE